LLLYLVQKLHHFRDVADAGVCEWFEINARFGCRRDKAVIGADGPSPFDQHGDFPAHSLARDAAEISD
jgi:hypothetical protein